MDIEIRLVVLGDRGGRGMEWEVGISSANYYI